MEGLYNPYKMASNLPYLISTSTHRHLLPQEQYIHPSLDTMPVTILMFMPRKAGTSIEQFRNHYEHNHVPLIKDALGGCLPVSHTRYYFDESAEYDCITKLEFRDGEHSAQFNDAFATSPRKAELEADQAAFVDGSRMKVMVVEEEIALKF